MTAMNILETGKGEGGLRCRPRPNWGHPEGPKTRYVASIPTHQNCAACSSRKARRCPGERLNHLPVVRVDELFKKREMIHR